MNGFAFPPNVLDALLLLGLWGVVVGVVRARLGGHRSPPTPEVSREGRSIRVIGLPFALSFALPLVLFFLDAGPQLPGFVLYAGAVLAITGIALQGWSMNLLGRFFTLDVVTRADHRLIREGPYGVVRHPIYTTHILIATGVSLVVGNALGFVFALGVTATIFTWRTRIEEQQLLRRFGKEYEEYQATTWRLFPGLL